MQKILKINLLILLAISIIISLRTYFRYSTSDEMLLKVREYSKEEYPDNPNNYGLLHSKYNQYSHNKIKLIQNIDSTFSFVLEPPTPKSATIKIKNVDVSLMTPSISDWVKEDPNITRIALTDREWNNQKVLFKDNIEIVGGDGFERAHVDKVELVKNSLNAGLWEVILYADDKQLYHGWFSFPLGHYKQLFEKNTGLSYIYNWYYLEYWFDPEGLNIDISKIRKIKTSKEVTFKNKMDDSFNTRGEQTQKYNNIIAGKITKFSDFYNNNVQFVSFIKPGIFTKQKLKDSKLEKLEKLTKVNLNDINPVNNDVTLQELDLIYTQTDGEIEHFYIGGFNLKQLPKSTPDKYDQGYFRLMGIGTPPLKQDYLDLVKNKPHNDPFYSFILTKEGNWINHSQIGVDGSILFLDESNDKILHVYLVSYQQHALIAHYEIDITSNIGMDWFIRKFILKI